MDATHRLLQRQLKRHLGESFSIPAEWQAFLSGVNAAYLDFDADRGLLEHSLELSSQELLDANSEMRAVFQAIPDLVFRLNHQGVILDVKTGASGELRFARHELVGKRLQDTPLKDVAREFAEAIEQVVAKNSPVSIEYSAVRLGQESDYEARLVPLPDKQIVVIIRNITERKQPLRLLAAAVEQSTESITITDMELDLPGPRIIFVNPAFTRMTGYSAREVLGRTPRILQGPRSDRAVLRRLRTTLGRGEIFKGETVNYRKDGTEFNVEWEVAPIRNSSGLVTHFLGVQRDVTARKRAEDTLRESHEKFHQLADNITDAFWIRSPDMREVYYISPAFERIWGRSVASLQADPMGWTDFTLPEDRARVAEAFSALMGAAPDLDIEFRLMRPDGEIRWVHVRGFQVRDAAHRLISLSGIATDITGRKRAELELAQTHTQLLAVSRQAGMAEFATGILHNVGNVLNSVNVASTCVADSLRKSKGANLARLAALLREHEHALGDFFTNNHKGRQVPAYLSQLAAELAAEQAAALRELAQLQKNIEHIRDIVTRQQRHAKAPGQVETANATELVEDALRLSGLARSGIEILNEGEDGSAILVEKHQALQILVNLLRNARQSCDESAEPEKRLLLRVTAGNGRIRFAVIDNGVGIPPENLGRIFVHGFTTKPDGHGFGLHSGAVAARELGGSLEAQSAGAGHGATFILELPTSAGPAPGNTP